MKNTLKEKLQNHQQPIGTFFELGSANVAEALGKTGLDFIIIDNEHGPFEAESNWTMSAAPSLAAFLLWQGYGKSAVPLY